ncbi:sensor histidine kinase [Desulfobaculum sp.]
MPTTSSAAPRPPAASRSTGAGTNLSLLVYLVLFISLTVLTIATTIEHNKQSHLNSIADTTGALARHFAYELTHHPEDVPHIQHELTELARHSSSVMTINIISTQPSGAEPRIIASSNPKRVGTQPSERAKAALAAKTASKNDCTLHGRPGVCFKVPLTQADGSVFGLMTYSVTMYDNTAAVWLYTAVTAILFMIVAYMLHRQQRRTHEELSARRVTERELTLREAQLRQIIDLVPHLIFAKDEESRFILANTSVASIHGLKPWELVGKKQSELTSPLPEQTVRFIMDDKKVMRTGTSRIGYEEELTCAGGQTRIYETSKIPFTTKGHSAVLGVGIDITERKAMESELRRHKERLEELVDERTKALQDANTSLENEIAERAVMQRRIEQSLEEKNMLLQEVHHRVMNNLQVISGLLDMAQRRADTPAVAELAGDLSTKIHSISLVHTLLYRSDRFDTIDFAQYMRQLTAHLQVVFDARRITIEYDLTPVSLPIATASPCGMVVNELVSNALKHAFPGGAEGTLRLRLWLEHGTVHISVADTGVGIPPDFAPATAASMGLRLITNIVTFQLQGAFTYSNDNGTLVSISFPLPDHCASDHLPEPATA